MLQAYALKTILEKKGNRVTIMPYRPCIPQYKYFQTENLNIKYAEKIQKFDLFRIKYLEIKNEKVDKGEEILKSIVKDDILEIRDNEEKQD